MRVIFKAPNQGAPKSKLAEAEVVFDQSEGDLLDGLTLTGFTVWARRDGTGAFLEGPGRQYEKAGEKKTWEFLRAASMDARPKLDNLKALIVEEYHAWANSGGGPF